MYRNCSKWQKQFLCTTSSPHDLSLGFSCIELVIQWTILWVSWCKNKSFWQRFACTFCTTNFSDWWEDLHTTVCTLFLWATLWNPTWWSNWWWKKPKVLAMSFYPEFIWILVKFNPNFIRMKNRWNTKASLL